MADVELNSIGNGDGNNYLVRDNTKIPLSGSSQISGDLIPSTDGTVNLGGSSYAFNSCTSKNIYGNDQNGNLRIWATESYGYGGMIEVCGKGLHSGRVRLIGMSDSNTWCDLIVNANGTLSWSGTSIVPTSNNTCDLGSSSYGFANLYTNKIYVTGNEIYKTADNSYLFIGGATTQANGANLVLNGKDRSANAGEFKLESRDGTNTYILKGTTYGYLTWSGLYLEPTRNDVCNLGRTDVKWKEIWCTQSSINSSSDERQKQQIKPIDNDLLDAWENVNPIQFKWNDAVAKKGDNARVHTGYIAQNIQQALTENGVNPNDYGLFLYDEWGEEQEEKDEQGNIIKPYKPSGNAYGLRYTEALIVECAYLRKKNKDLQEQLNALSERLEKLENR